MDNPFLPWRSVSYMGNQGVEGVYSKMLRYERWPVEESCGGNYFDELLARIRDIRSSEKVFYRKVLEIYALSLDYEYVIITRWWRYRWQMNTLSLADEYVFVLGDRYKRIRISNSSELP